MGQIAGEWTEGKDETHTDLDLDARRQRPGCAGAEEVEAARPQGLLVQRPGRVHHRGARPWASTSGRQGSAVEIAPVGKHLSTDGAPCKSK
jgi:hypothetical protein